MSESDEMHLQPYREAAQHYGPGEPGFKAALWGSRETQVLRFDIILNMVDLSGSTVLDIGCGTGDFAQQLIEREIPFKQFIGIDAVEQVIHTARSRELPGCTFHKSNVLEELDTLQKHHADFAVLSGTLNTMSDPDAYRLVESAFEASAQGVIFNFLSDRPDPKWLERELGPARRFSTIGWLDWALSRSPRVHFTQDYLAGHDATILIRH